MKGLGLSIGMLLLAILLIVWGVVSLGVMIPYSPQVLGILAIASGVCILIRK